MIRILNIISDTNIGGAGRVILNYLRYADRNKFETLVAIPRGSLLKPLLEEAEVTVYEVDGMADCSYASQDVKALQALIRRVKPDLVHTHGALSGRIAAKRCHVPVVYSRHSAFPVPAKLKYPPGRWVNKLLNEHYADHIIAVSPATRDNLTEGGISPKKITVVMNGVAPVSPISDEQKAALRRSLGLEPDVFTFGILARIEDYKGHLYLVYAAKLLKDRGYSNFRILVAGTGAFEEEVTRAVTEMGVEDVVKMLGFRSDAAALLNIQDVQLNASYGTEATSLQDMTEFELPQKKPQRVQPEGALDGYLYYQLDTGDTSASAPVLVIGFEKSKFFEDSLPVHILLTIPEHQVRIQLTGTVSAQTVVLTAPTSRMKDEDIQTLVQIRDTIQSVLQFVQSTADSMQKAG